MNALKQTMSPELPLLLGVMGDPVIQSKSPVMHQAALRASGLAGSYVPLHVEARCLEEAILGVRALGFRGVNVTVPHKVDCIPFLDEVDEGAMAIGAVNTIVNDGGRLKGYNTDGIGYIRSLKEEAVSDLAGKNVLVLGSGGAARGIVHALLGENPGRITVANRTADKARSLAAEWSGLGPLAGCGMEEIAGILPEIDILINTTSVGMYPHPGQTPIDPALLPSGIVVSDLIYNPLKTELLIRAEQKGCRIHNGLGMFVYQGGYAFEYWTGLTAPVEAMRSAVLGTLV